MIRTYFHIMYSSGLDVKTVSVLLIFSAHSFDPDQTAS